jgi:protein O-mannosyl-transferase
MLETGMGNEQQGNPPRQGPALLAGWRPFLLILAAAALAHLWCLGAQFYMDDASIIRDNEAILTGGFLRGKLLAWTNFWYAVQYRVFGMSPVGFHAVNWLLHAGVACVAFGLGRDFVRGRAPEGVALFGALWFAVHPLASEIPNYARTQDLAWVTLFSLLASWAMLGFLQSGGRWKLVGVVLGVTGAAMSKGPGLFHALMMTGTVGLAFMTTEHWRNFRRWSGWLAAVVVVGLAVLWVAGILPGWLRYTATWSEPRFIGHAYTLARVFWEFAWRAVIPVALSSDHHIAESLVPPGYGWLGIPDRTAVWAAVAMLALAAASVLLAWRKPTRLVGLCLFLFTSTILFRVMYLVPEFMPEYRIYPGMPWFCLGAALVGWACWKRLPGGGSPAWLAVLILLPCIVLSARRSFLWHDLDRLTADVLRQYPAQARAVWELHDRDLHAGDWQKVIDRQRTVWPRVFARFLEENRRLAPTRELPSGHFALADVACAGRYAIALVHVEGPAAGLAEIRRLEAHMRRLGIDPATNRTIWGFFHHARATVMEQTGNFPQALESMRFEGVYKINATDIARVEAKLAGPR